MNRRVLLAIVSLAAFGLQAGLRTRLQTEQEESKLVIAAADQRGMSADVAVPVLALGAFRGVVVDYLWLRSIALRDQGRTYEARQIAELICRLQPRLPAVWSYLASHLAYDLAATDPSAPGRYRWVQNGIQLLRDQGLRYNPDAAELYYTLARIYQDKIGATMDAFHLEMKQFLALDMLFLLGSLSVAELAQTAPLDALAQQDPQVAALEAAIRGALETDREGVIARLLALEYQLARGKRAQLKPDLRRALAFRDEAGYRKLLRAARRTLFAERSKMSVRRMAEVDRTWGPTDGSGLDWHAAETHALYWALEGMRVGQEHGQDREVRRCRQTAVLALKNAMRRGRIRFFDDGSTFTAPIPELVERLERIYRANIDAARSESDATRRSPESTDKQVLQANAHLNNQIMARADFLGEAITLLAQYGRDSDGRRLLAIAHKAYPTSPEFDIPFENFLLNTLAKRYSDAGLYDSQSGMTQLLEGTWSQAFVFLALGEDARYRTFERLAKTSEKRWSAYLAAQAKEEPGVYRRLGINFTLVQRRALQQAARRLPPSLRGMLAQRAGVSAQSLGGPPPSQAGAAMSAVGLGHPGEFDPSSLLGLARTQYLELIRQPVFGVVLLVGTLLVALSPALAVFALGRADALILDLSASAMLFFVVFLSATAVAAGNAERLTDGTTAVVLTHPVSPSTILLGNLIGAITALAQAGVVLTCALLWAVRNGPDAIHLAVVIPALTALGSSFAWGVRASLVRRAFQPAAINAASVVFPALYLISLNVKYDLTWQPMEGIPTVAVAAAYLALLAGFCFAALGGAIATRLPSAATAILTLTAFLLASLVRGPLGPESIGPLSALTIVLPDLQLFWIGDAAYTRSPVPFGYVVEMTLYTCLYSVGALALGGVLLEGRELGR